MYGKKVQSGSCSAGDKRLSSGQLKSLVCTPTHRRHEKEKILPTVQQQQSNVLYMMNLIRRRKTSKGLDTSKKTQDTRLKWSYIGMNGWTIQLLKARSITSRCVKGRYKKVEELPASYQHTTSGLNELITRTQRPHLFSPASEKGRKEITRCGFKLIILLIHPFTLCLA